MSYVDFKQGPQSPEATTKPHVAPVPPWLRRLPNQLTLMRILCIPLVVWLMLQGNEAEPGVPFQMTWADIAAALVFTLAAVTDFFDGWIARRYGIETLFGKLFDPLADKLLVVSALIILVEQHRLAGWIAVVLIVRDLGINAVRLAAMEENILISSSWIGKTKTTLLDIGIVGLILYGNLLFINGYLIGTIAIWCALAASLISGGQYLWEYGRRLKQV